MKAYIKAWQSIIDPKTNKVYDEEGLRHLDGIKSGNVRDVDEITPEIEKNMLDEFRMKYPDFVYDNYKLFTEDDGVDDYDTIKVESPDEEDSIYPYSSIKIERDQCVIIFRRKRLRSFICSSHGIVHRIIIIYKLIVKKRTLMI